MKRFVVTCLNLLFLVRSIEAADILCIYPVPFYSHQIVQRAVTDELATHGHQLVVLTTLPHQESVENITDIDVHELSYAMWDNTYDEASKSRATFAISDIVVFWDMINDMMSSMLLQQMEHPEFQAIFQDETKQFDLILLEGNLPQHIALQRFKAPVLLVSSMSCGSEVFNQVGAESNHFLYPDFNMVSAYNLSFLEKIWSLYNLARFKLAMWQTNKNSGLDISVPNNFKEDITMLFLNMHRFWDNNRPAPIGSVLYIGGAHLKEHKSLPKDLETFVNQSKHGVIFVSLGSKLKSSTLPAHILKTMIDVFALLPYDIVWKWDDSVMPNKPKNILLQKWLPQYDLLHHPNVKAFVTHGGMQSTEEAIDAAVPMIGLPVFLDQWLNTHQYEKHGIGIRLDIDTLTGESFRDAILSILNDRRYRENIDRLSRASVDVRGRGGLEAAARAVRRLAAHGPAHLRTPLADATLFEFYMIDLILITLIFLAILYYLIILVSKRVINSLQSYLVILTTKEIAKLD